MEVAEVEQKLSFAGYEDIQAGIVNWPMSVIRLTGRDKLRVAELAHIRSKEISFIFQGYNLIPSLNVWKNVALPMTYQGIAPTERYERAIQALDSMGIADRAEARPTVLSGGQQQRVAIARAIATRSPIIMADEPTGALDSKTGQQVLDILRELHKNGTTVILITHDNGIAAKAERIIRLSDGKIVEDRLNVPDETCAIGHNF